MTADELFMPARPRDRLPFRSRRTVDGRADAYGPDTDGFELLVLRDTARAIRDAARQASPHEAFGLLSGQSYADERGPYTVVVGAVRARWLQAGPGHVRLSGKEMAALRATAERANPAADLVGWWHSHHSPSGYSDVDRAEQATWPSAHHVGLLVFAAADEQPTRAYRGPDGRALEARLNRPYSYRPPVLSLPAAGISAPAPARPAAVPPSDNRQDGAGPRKPWASALGIGVAAVALIVALVGFWPRFVNAPRPGPAEPKAVSLDWRCRPLSERAVRCRGPVGVGVTSWHWQFDEDADLADGPVVDHVFAEAGPHRASLVVATPDGSRSAGVRWFVVDTAQPAIDGADPPAAAPGRASLQ